VVLTEADIIKAIGRKDASAKKSAQSNIWKLRNHDADGNRLDLSQPRDAKRALLKTVPLSE